MKPIFRTVVILLVFLGASVAAALLLDPFSASEWANDNVRLAGAGALCLLIFAALTVAGKRFGAFPKRPTDELSPKRSDCNEPLLTGQQTLDLIRLFQHSLILEMLEQFVYMCDAAGMGRRLPSRESLVDHLDTARHEGRGVLLRFPIVFKESDLEQMYGSADSASDVDRAYELADDTSKPLEVKVREFRDMAKSRSERTLHEYRLRLAKFGIPL